jgi:amino acid adenylation domain-containing protein
MESESVEDFDELSPAQQALVEWNNTQADYPRTSCLHELIEAQAERSPESVALVYEQHTLTYREMNARANQLARHLRTLGVRPEFCVGICMERSLETVISLLAILKAGGAYLPLDPAYPKDRLAFMLADSNVEVLLTQRPLLHVLPSERWLVLCIDLEWWERAKESPRNLASLSKPENLAYVIYTSGSTGRPKGVEVTHRGLCNLVETQVHTCGVRPGDRVLHFCSLSFDPSIFEIGAALRAGATLVVAPQRSLSPGPALARVLRDQGVTAIVLPPSVLSPLPDEPFPSLKTLVVGAEPVTAEFVKRWEKGRRIFNIYGATETTVFSTIAECHADGRKPSIGRPIANTQIYLLDSHLRPVPVGVPGELYVGGVGLARGYVNRPELTAERFIPDPFAREPGARLYRTGDVARYLPGGDIDFLGRVDYQVKVRGHRIEVEEIETVLAEHPSVRQAVVLAREDAAGNKRLVAYVVPDCRQPPSLTKLRDALKAKVPDYMVPPVFMMLNALPLSPNGKVDRNALPAPNDGRPELEMPYEAPQSRLEHLLAELWQQVLGIGKIGIKDSFFELGGDSIKAAVFLNELQQLLGEAVYVVAMFDAPTIVGLATYLNNHYPEAVSRICRTEKTKHEESREERIDAAKLAQLRQIIGSSVSFAESTVPIRSAKPSAVIILCPPRSGSTLLRVMLAGHPDLFAPPELELMTFTTLDERRAAFSGRHSFWLQGTIRAIMEIKGCDAETAKRIMDQCEERQLTTWEFYSKMQEWIGAKTLVEKTTSYALDLQVLRRAETYFDNPLYIHLLRHPRGMIRSFQGAKLEQLFRREHPFSPRELAELIWLVSHQNILEFLKEVPKERWRQVKFEDLVSQPRATVEDVCDFLGLGFHPDMLQPYEHLGRRMTDDLHGLPRMLGDISFHSHQGIDARVADSWKEDGTEDSLGGITWQVAETLGYGHAGSKAGSEGTGYTPIQPILHDACMELPLSFGQRRLWFLDQLQPSNPAYTSSQAIRIQGALNVAALQQALEAIVARHASLRTTFRTVVDSPIQVIKPRAGVTLCLKALSAPTDGDLEAAALGVAAQEVRQTFDLEHGPLLRTTLLRLNDDDHLLLVTIHHIVSDGWSMGVLIQELLALYSAFSSGEAPALPELPIQYADFAVWQRQWLQGPLLEKLLSYWKRQLGGRPAPVQLPTDNPRPGLETLTGGTLSFVLPKAQTDVLIALSRKRASTLFMTLLAAFQTLLHRYTNQKEILVGTPVANRSRLEIERLIGFFVNTLVLRTDLSGDPTFQELLGRVREVALQAYAHQDLPFEKLVEELQPERDLSRNPLFQVMFILQNAPLPKLEMPNLRASWVEVESGTAKFDLTLSMQETEAGLRGKFEYNSDLFDADTIMRMVGHWQTLLEGIVANPEQRLSELPLLSAAERRQLLVEWNDRQADYPREQCIHQLLEAQVERTPEAVAVVFGEQQLSYRELNRRGNQLAHYLRALGVGPEVRVGLCVERSLEMIVGLVGILKAGGAYVPLDPAYPKERLAFMLKDSEVEVLLTQRGLVQQMPDEAPRTVCLDDPDEEAHGENSTNPTSGVRPDNLAYVMYTSGSAGKPKGVEIAHRGVVRLLFGVDFAHFQKTEVFLQLAPISFDASNLEVWGALLHGGQCILFTNESPTTQDLGVVLKEKRVSTLWLTASLFNAVIDEDPEILQNVEQLLVGGETLSTVHVRQALQFLVNTKLINGYGPTENTTFTCCHPIPRSLDRSVSSVPIGRPIANTQVYILDRHLQPVPIKAVGELHVGGDGLARGYLKQRELTAEKFIPNPFSSTPGARLYKTGDLARYLPDGTVEFMGRLDQQVKIRGFRVEPGEVESVLAEHRAVKTAAVVVGEESSREKRLWAFITLRAGFAPAAEDLRTFLKHKLPRYMLPSRLEITDSLPLTRTGKVDRNRLRTLSGLQPARKHGYSPPRTALEEKLANIWAEVLNLERVGVQDNFFDLGGHSLLAVKLIAKVEKHTGKKISLAAVFQAPTIQDLAHVISCPGSPAEIPGVIPIQPTGSGPPFFCLGAGPLFRPLALRLGTEHPFLGLGLGESEMLHLSAPFKLEDIAAVLVAKMRMLQPEGPYCLGGWCDDGILAYEVAQQLQVAGQRIASLVLFDAWNPTIWRSQSGSEAVRARLHHLSDRLRYHLSNLRGIPIRELWEYLAAAWNSQIQIFGKKLWATRYKLLLRMKGKVPSTSVDFNKIEFVAVRSYEPKPFRGHVVLFWSGSEDRKGDHGTALGWRDLVPRGSEIHRVPGGHRGMFNEPDVEVLAKVLRTCLWEAQEAERGSHLAVTISR